MAIFGTLFGHSHAHPYERPEFARVNAACGQYPLSLPPPISHYPDPNDLRPVTIRFFPRPPLGDLRPLARQEQDRIVPTIAPFVPALTPPATWPAETRAG